MKSGLSVYRCINIPTHTSLLCLLCRQSPFSETTVFARTGISRYPHQKKDVWPLHLDHLTPFNIVSILSLILISHAISAKTPWGTLGGFFQQRDVILQLCHREGGLINEEQRRTVNSSHLSSQLLACISGKTSSVRDWLSSLPSHHSTGLYLPKQNSAKWV